MRGIIIKITTGKGKPRWIDIPRVRYPMTVEVALVKVNKGVAKLCCIFTPNDALYEMEFLIHRYGAKNVNAYEVYREDGSYKKCYEIVREMNLSDVVEKADMRVMA